MCFVFEGRRFISNSSHSFATRHCEAKYSCFGRQCVWGRPSQGFVPRRPRKMTLPFPTTHHHEVNVKAEVQMCACLVCLSIALQACRLQPPSNELPIFKVYQQDPRMQSVRPQNRAVGSKNASGGRPAVAQLLSFRIRVYAHTHTHTHTHTHAHAPYLLNAFSFSFVLHLHLWLPTNIHEPLGDLIMAQRYLQIFCTGSHFCKIFILTLSGPIVDIKCPHTLQCTLHYRIEFSGERIAMSESGSLLYDWM
jgi:hypothetical protein